MSNNKSKDKLSRRTFVKKAAFYGAAGVGLFGLAATPLLKRDTGDSFKDLFQKHYKKLDEEKLKIILKKLEEKTKKQYGADVRIDADKPIKDVVFGYALNLDVCIGCRKCVQACVEENNQSRDPAIEYIRVLELDKGGFNLEHAEHNYDHEVPLEDKFYLPVQCHQCENPPCVRVCPTKATWQEKDGITVVDYNWCIGCRYCQAACPYDARKFNFFKPKIKAEEINPRQSYLGNRIRPAGVIEKCTFCIQRTRKGLMPACLEACPTGARKFGDLTDQQSSVRYILENKNVYVFKEELGTIPRFFYYFD
ncbi:MAG: 4Fe-4S dicluster domain-containing protein [Candidatus Aminicenantes bacterium]|nr:4Fe-4S dicluster domain-containing protein [Candidatus Aminicenantes bacterium]